MYINQEFKKFISQQEISDSTEISGLIKQIKDFYKKFNDKIERYTSRYRTAVDAILNQFTIIVRQGLDGKIGRLYMKILWMK